MSKDWKILLRHILESIEALEAYLVGVNETFYLANLEKQDSAERRLQIIGEAVVKLPDELKEAHPEIPWNQVAGLRNRLVHEYFDIDHKLVWKTLEVSIPAFKKQIIGLLGID